MIFNFSTSEYVYDEVCDAASFITETFSGNKSIFTIIMIINALVRYAWEKFILSRIIYNIL